MRRRVPDRIDRAELDDLAEGNALTPVKLSETSETATVTHSGKAGEITNWAQMTAMYADPYAEYAKLYGTTNSLYHRLNRTLA